MTDDGPAFDPDDLDFTDDERVEEIDDGRYVVSAGSGPPRVPSDAERLAELLGESADDDQAESTEPDPDATSEEHGVRAGTGAGTSRSHDADRGDSGRPPSRSEPRPISSRDVSRWLATSFEDDGFEFGFDATLSVGDEVVRHRMVSGDVSATFETLLTWFTRNAAGEAPIDEALGILIAASETPVQFPRGTLDRYVERHGLTREDSIGDLLAVAEAHGGLRIGTPADGEPDGSGGGSADVRTGDAGNRPGGGSQPTEKGQPNEGVHRTDRDHEPNGTDSRDGSRRKPKDDEDDAGGWNWIGEDPER